MQDVKVTGSDIAIATQVFTPEWMVRYMADNSLGRLWMLNNPDSSLSEVMEYYIPSEGDCSFSRITSAEDIRVLDPACGSGHILVYAFDLLYIMYEEEGWLPEDIPAMILQNNLTGYEIDRRAAEIASFALEMKALEKDPCFLEKGINANIHVLESVELSSEELLRVPQLAQRRELLEAMGHLDEVGSLYVPDGWDAFTLDNEIARIGEDRSLFSSNLPEKLKEMRSIVGELSKTHHVVIANPPYRSSSKLSLSLSDWMKRYYPEEKSDLFSCFIKRIMWFGSDKSFLGITVSNSWMFLSSFEASRKEVLARKSIETLVQLSVHGFRGIAAQLCAFVLSDYTPGFHGGYIRLNDFDHHSLQEPKTKEAIHNPDCGWFYLTDADDFKAIPGWPIAYWASNSVLSSFAAGRPLSESIEARQGFTSGNNSLFIRLWHEVALSRTALSFSTKSKWYPCDKGGLFRRWYGNNDFVADWEDDGRKLKAFHGSTVRNSQYYLKEAFSWSDISSAILACRYKPEGFVFEHCSDSLFDIHEKLLVYGAFLNSSTAQSFLAILSPTMKFEVGQIRSLPICFSVPNSQIERLSEACIALSRKDWDSFETSWDFSTHPLVRTSRIADAYALWESECRERFDTLKANEEELNRIFARIYGMEGEVPIEVPDDKVSVRLADRARDARSLISYGIGCMLGRYSIDEPGLVLADEGKALDDFREKVPHATFLPDADNVLPVLDAEWFEDDIVAGFRSWLAAAYGESTVDENVAWLEGSVGKGLRSYFCKDFYADHIKVYQKRPIYWMFSSPRGAFRCLVYMHRYNEGTVGTVLTGYLRPFEDKLRARIQMLSASGAARDVREADRLRAQLAEVEAWEREVVYPLAHERVSIDLDDGVKVNYNRFPKALAKVTGLSEWK